MMAESKVYTPKRIILATANNEAKQMTKTTRANNDRLVGDRKLFHTS